MRYLAYAILDLLFTAFAIVCCNWWAPVFASEDGWLPQRLRWLQTFDNSLDAGWNWPGAPYETQSPTRWQRHWLRVKWLNRNPAYGFCYWALGAPFEPEKWTVIRRNGIVFHAVGPYPLFNFFYYGKWGMYKLGWKAMNYFDPATGTWKTTPWGPEMRVPVVCSLNPFKRIMPGMESKER